MILYKMKDFLEKIFSFAVRLTLTRISRSCQKVQIVANVPTLVVLQPEQLAYQLKANVHMEGRSTISCYEFVSTRAFSSFRVLMVRII